MMMKLFSFFLLAASAAAFTSPTFGIRPPTKTFMVPDRDFVNKVNRDGEDAVKVIYQECDVEECSMVEGVKEGDEWHFEGEEEEDNKEVVSRRILMWEKEDTE